MSVPYSERTRVLVVFGTRPEAIKMIPVIKALQESEMFKPIVMSTGQHSGMVEQLIANAGLRIDANLHVADARDGKSPTLNQMVSRVISRIDMVWQEQETPERFRADGRRGVERIAACLVHGDTSSAAAAALAAFNLQVPVVHVEAGLRTSNLLSPFPEEGNRQLISRIAALHFAPTSVNKMNLVREGIDYDRVFVTGNTSIDMLHLVNESDASYGSGLESIEGTERRIVLVTAHRRENWGEGIENIARAVAQLAEGYPEIEFVVPLHPNPIARVPMTSHLQHFSNAHLVEPREYASFAKLMGDASLIITDSGGVQEEAPALQTPVLVARDTTERQEGVDAGTLKLVGTDTEVIVREARRLLDDEVAYRQMAERSNPYGDGLASQRIVAALDHVLHDAPAPMPYLGEQLRQAVRRHAGLSESSEA